MVSIQYLPDTCIIIIIIIIIISILTDGTV